MTVIPHVRLLRLALLLSLTAATAPICGAAQQPADPARRVPSTDKRASRETAWMASADLTGTAFPLLAQLGTGSIGEATPPLMLARGPEFPSAFRAPAPATMATSTEAAMGLPLPEPGPLSAIIATVALAAFFFIRRAR